MTDSYEWTDVEKERFLTLIFHQPKWDKFLTHDLSTRLYLYSASYAKASWDDEGAPTGWPLWSRAMAQVVSVLCDFGIWTNKVRTACRLRLRKERDDGIR